jgi:hypothetical protein
MLFCKKHKDCCHFCESVLEGYGYRERGKLYCNEYCASDEEEFSPRARTMSLDQLEAELSYNRKREKSHAQ